MRGPHTRKSKIDTDILSKYTRIGTMIATTVNILPVKVVVRMWRKINGENFSQKETQNG